MIPKFLNGRPVVSGMLRLRCLCAAVIAKKTARVTVTSASWRTAAWFRAKRCSRGIPHDALLAEMRERQVVYLVGTPRSKVAQHAKKWLDQPWHQVRDSVRVKLIEHEGKLWVLAESRGRRAKEIAIRHRRLARLLRKLRRLRRRLPARDRLLLRIGVAKKEAGRAFGLVKIQVPEADQPLICETFQFHPDKAKLQELEQHGHYLLPSNLTSGDPAVL